MNTKEEDTEMGSGDTSLQTMGRDYTECSYRVSYLPAKSKMIRKVVLDLISVLFLLVPILCLYVWGVPYHRGFNCDDDSIRYPYKDNTISSVALYFYSTTIPLVTIVLNEFIIIRSKCRSVSTDQLAKLVSWNCYCQLVSMIFTIGASQLITDISKYSIGRLRPHFIDLCQPQLATGEIIKRTSTCTNPYAYEVDYECSNPRFLDNHKLMRDGHLSFMSGHSSFSAVCLIYLVLYIQMRVKWSVLGLCKPLSQVLLVALIVYTCLSRISDYKHHWSDVLTGAIQGTLVAILGALFVSDLYKSHEYYKGSPSKPSYEDAIHRSQSNVV